MVGPKTTTCAVCGDFFEYFDFDDVDDDDYNDPERLYKYCDEFVFQEWLCKKCHGVEPELQERLFGEKRKRKNKPGLKIYLDMRRSGAPLHREAIRREKRPGRRRQRPPQLTADNVAELKKLHAQIHRIKIRALERAIAEWEDVWASPTALRYLGELIDEARAAEKQAREEEKRRKREFWFGKPDSSPQDLATLGVPENATKEQINKHYRELVKTLHPDVTDGSAEKIAMFHRVTNAMERLRERGRA
jgi:hypothetical protein